jgi:hypothetical protein
VPDLLSCHVHGLPVLELLDDSFEGPLPSIYRAGDRLAEKYTLLQRLGVGGMGEVWAARSDALDSKVAIKLIRGGTPSPTGQRRLLREARATARLAEPSIVRVFDFGTSEHGEPFIVMEFLDGEDLARHLRDKKRLDPVEAVRMLLPIVGALTVAHAAGIIHRDVKPENVFLTKTATGGVQPKLLDFGIAQLGSTERLTGSRSLVGSAEYMSPEQARGEDVDASADTWALCVVLYEAVSGKSPFFARNYNATAQNILTKDPAPWPDFGDGSAELWAIVEKGLCKKSGERYRTSRGLGQALAEWLAARGVTEDLAGTSLASFWGERTTMARGRSPHESTRRTKRLMRAFPASVVTGALILLVALLAAGITVMRRWESGRHAARLSETNAAVAPRTTAEAHEAGPPSAVAVVPAGAARGSGAVHAQDLVEPTAAAPSGEDAARPPTAPASKGPAQRRRTDARPAPREPARATPPQVTPSIVPAPPSPAAFRNPFD